MTLKPGDGLEQGLPKICFDGWLSRPVFKKQMTKGGTLGCIMGKHYDARMTLPTIITPLKTEISFDSPIQRILLGSKENPIAKSFKTFWGYGWRRIFLRFVLSKRFASACVEKRYRTQSASAKYM